MTAPKPMDPVRLDAALETAQAVLRETLHGSPPVETTMELATALLACKADRDYHARLLADVLAVIHGDGGQRMDSVGVEQAVADAQARWHERDTEAVRVQHAARVDRLLGQVERAESERDETRAEVRRLEAMLIARQDAELEAGPPSEMELRLLDATREVARLRARVRVEAEDVERAGVTPAKCDAYMQSQGWEKMDEGGWAPATWERDADLTKRPMKARDEILADIAFGWDNYVAECIDGIVAHGDRCGLDILDEMAALEVGS